QPESEPHAMVRLLARIVGVGVETADLLVHEVLSRPMRDRRAVTRYAGLTGSPDESGARRREQGLARAGNARVFSLPRQGDRYAVGAVSPNTIDLLLEAGYVYLGNGLADDIPHYWVSNFASRRALLTLPYYYHFDDQFFLMFPRKGTGLEHPDALLRCC